MEQYKRIYIIPIALFSAVAIVHNTYLAQQTANLHTGYGWLDWLLAGVFAFAIESALWTLIIHQKFQAVKAYALLLGVLNLVYYGRGGKLHQIISFIHPEAWLYVEGILMALIFSALLSGFLWYLTEVAIDDMRARASKKEATTSEVAPSLVATPVVPEVVAPVAVAPAAAPVRK